MQRFRLSLVMAVGLAVAVAVSLGATRASAGKGDRVVVEPGQKVQIAVSASGEFGGGFAVGIGNAVAMAVAMHPTVSGFPVQLNTTVSPGCGVPEGEKVVAEGIVANTQNTGVIGPFCSSGARYSLPVYEAAGVVVVSGSASAVDLPPFAPTVFNRTVVEGPPGPPDPWFVTVTGLQSVKRWTDYHAAFPPAAPTSEFDAFSFDAATLLLDRLQQVSKIKDGNLVIDRKELAKVVRRTTDFPGVTCTVAFDRATGNRLNDPASLAGCAG